jgi:DNA-binding transcriptional MerR regulator
MARHRDMSIGKLARETGVKVPTIRYYESVELLPRAERTDSNRRLYGDRDVRRLSFIRHARELGFEVDAIRELLALADDPQRPCADVDAIAQAHLADIDSKIARLKLLRSEVNRILGECARGRIGDCRVIEALGSHAHCRSEHKAAGRGVKVRRR